MAKWLEPERTGARIIFFREDCQAADAAETVARRIGRQPLRSSAAGDAPDALSAGLRRDGAVIFEEFGLGIVDPRAVGAEDAVVDALAEESAVLAVRPEYRVTALGPWRWFFPSRESKAAAPAPAAPEPAAAPSAPPPAADPAPAPAPETAPETAAETAAVSAPASEAPPPEREPADSEPAELAPAPAPVEGTSFTPTWRVGALPGAEVASILAQDGQAHTWGLRAIGADRPAGSGAGVRVAVLDTGFDPQHRDFIGRRVTAANFSDAADWTDRLGHGTHVAGTILGPWSPQGAPRYGVAPDAELFVAKVLDDEGAGREGDVLAGLLWALNQGCQIINMSLGRPPAPGDVDGDYERIGRQALARGALIIAAAGNESERRIGFVSPVGAPANAPSVMAVGAVDRSLTVAPFSNGGVDSGPGAVDIAAPGVDVLSATPGSKRYSVFSGTSMAAPHVAGAAALLTQQDPSLTGQALWDALTSGARPIQGGREAVGAGLVQAPQAETPPPDEESPEEETAAPVS